jgi:hypothetical protein
MEMVWVKMGSFRRNPKCWATGFNQTNVRGAHRVRDVHKRCHGKARKVKPAFGTSSLYHEKNFRNAKPRSTLQFDVTISLSLCAGSYFVTLAIAEAVTHGDMSYLDRKTDVIVLKVSQARTIATGIAAHDSTVESTKVDR